MAKREFKTTFITTTREEQNKSIIHIQRRNTLIQYLKMKVDTEDWHAVADAAMDLRELEASK